MLSDTAEFCYKCDDFYHPDDECGLIWNDPGIGIQWPLPDGTIADELILSEKDRRWGTLEQLKAQKK